MDQISNLQQLFAHKLADLYSTEKQLTVALPEMAEHASDEKLRDALFEHLQATEEHITRLDEIGESFVFEKTGMVCKGIEGIIKEGKETLMKINDASTKDAAITGAGSAAEHYEMAGYMAAILFAKKLNFPGAADLLTKTLNDEKKADAMLQKLAGGGLLSEGLADEAIED